ncbi:TPA: ERF family protein [Pasteurella multocida]
MSIYKKLAQARVKLQEKELKKSGCNSFSKYDYFELKDFLPEVNRIFNELGLCSVVSFTEQLATLTIYDVDSEAKIEFTSPMKEANLKGCHEIQNLGAVETYQRRYLYMLALEIVEGDVLDENTGDENVTPKQKQKVATSQTVKPAVKPAVKHTVQPKKTFAEIVKERLEKCKSKEELATLYEKLVVWVKENYPNNIGEFDIIYNDKVLSFM